MATLVCLHAHPDDECISTGGTIARAIALGHRVVLVVATNGDHGEVPEDLAAGETLVDRRRAETMRSAAVLGIHRVEWLGYADSGMTGWSQNSNPDSLLQADLDEAAGRLAAILRDEHADIVTGYDWHGTYGHPDHIRVHLVAHRAAELVAGEWPGAIRVLDATGNRDAMKRFAVAERERRAAAGEATTAAEDDFDPDGPSDDGNPFGEPEAVITHSVDVTAYLAAKRESLRCHASQVSDSGFFAQMPDEVFAALFGTECFVEAGVDPAVKQPWLFG